MARGQGRSSGGGRARQGATLEVEVRDLKERPLPKASVALRPLAERRAPQVTAAFDEATGTFRASGLDPGRYILRARARGLEAQEREIVLQPAGSREVVVLGPKGAPFYYRGPVRVPFEPLPDLLAATLDPRAGPAAEEELRDLYRRLRLDPQEVSEEVLQQGVHLLRMRGSSGEQAKRRVLRELLASRWVLLAGPVIAVRERSLSFLTGELLVRFKPHVTDEDVRRLAAERGLDVLRGVAYSPNTFHLASPEPPTYELLGVLADLAAADDVEWAEPNLVTTAELDAIHPSDFLWPGVWDRRLAGTPEAWQLLQDAGLEAFGEPTVIIAGVDQGIQSAGGVPTSPEFQDTVSDGSSKVYRLYDFRTLVPDNDAPPGDHGMGIAAVAAAKAGNPSVVPGQDEGLAGAAPNCRIMGLIFPFTEVDITDMYIWAAGFDPNSPRPGFPPPISPGADIFTTSIGFGAGAPISGVASDMLDYLTTYGRGGKGCLCFFSAGNSPINFTTNRPWAAYERTWGMAASTLADDGVTEIRAPYSGFGPVELCAPSHDQYPILHNPPARYGTWACAFAGQGNLVGHAATQTTLAVPAGAGDTTVTLASVAGIAAGARLLLDLPGAAGSEPVQVTGPPDPVTGQTPVTALLNAHAATTVVSTGATGYRNDFGGTSSATPLAAGVAALVLSANPDLTWVEARQVMRDTAARIDAANTDPVGQWLDANGNPSVTSALPPVYSQWYGYGRVDAEQAVQEALVHAFTRDLVARDNLADTGTVPSGGPFWNSPDIWVRNADPAADGAGALPAGYGVAGPHQAPVAGQDNWVYARVRNAGTAPSLDFYVRLYLTHFPGTEFTYPSSFTPTNRPGQPVPLPMAPGTYLIGEVASTGLAPGADEVVNVLWPQALIPPQSVVVSGMSVDWHPCLLVEVSPHDGPIPTGGHVWDDNNLAQKNISIVRPDLGGDFAVGQVLGHPDSDGGRYDLDIDRSGVPRQVRLYVDLVDPRLKARLREVAAGTRPEEPAGCAVTFLEEARILLDCDPGDGAGVVLTVPAGSRLRTLVGTGSRRVPYNFTLGFVHGRDVAFLADRGTTVLPVLAGPGALVPVIVGGLVGQDAPSGTYHLHLVQRAPGGGRRGGSQLEIRIGT